MGRFIARGFILVNTVFVLVSVNGVSPFNSIGFSLWGIGPARFKIHRLDFRTARDKKSVLLKACLLGSFGVGADLLPAFGAFLCVENFLAQADGFRRDFDKLVVG